MKKTILIVDDNEPTVALLTGILKGAGYETLMALDGETAIDLANENQIHCSLIDQYMDPMDGFTLARAFQVDGHTFPMAMVTANESVDLLTQAQANGFRTIIMKPVQPERLIKLIGRLAR
jgi:two-component system response regulator ResD